MGCVVFFTEQNGRQELGGIPAADLIRTIEKASFFFCA
jgi:hypothetical protein